MFRSIPERLQWARKDQSGSVIVIALLLLVVMTLVGVTGMDTVVTENQIIRNVGLHQQNINLVEAAVMEGFQEVLSTPFNELYQIQTGGGDALSWGNNKEIWDESGTLGTQFCDPSTDRALDSGVNWKVPDSIQNQDITIIKTRGETGDQKLRLAILGWKTKGTESLKGTEVSMQVGRLLAEYLSDRYGMQRLLVKFQHLVPIDAF